MENIDRSEKLNELIHLIWICCKNAHRNYPDKNHSFVNTVTFHPDYEKLKEQVLTLTPQEVKDISGL